MKVLITISFTLIGFLIGWFSSDQWRKAAELETIQRYSDQQVEDLDRMVTWRGVTAAQILIIAEGKGEQEAWDYARRRVARFHEAYRNGLMIGDWQEMADMIYQKTQDWISNKSRVGTASITARRSVFDNLNHFGIGGSLLSLAAPPLNVRQKSNELRFY